jgi:hypothetical protein
MKSLLPELANKGKEKGNKKRISFTIKFFSFFLLPLPLSLSSSFLPFHTIPILHSSFHSMNKKKGTYGKERRKKKRKGQKTTKTKTPYVT